MNSFISQISELVSDGNKNRYGFYLQVFADLGDFGKFFISSVEEWDARAMRRWIARLTDGDKHKEGLRWLERKRDGKRGRVYYRLSPHFDAFFHDAYKFSQKIKNKR